MMSSAPSTVEPWDHVSGNDKHSLSVKVPRLRQYWQVALRWKWAIGGIVAGFLIIGLVITMLMTPQYTSTVRMEISREQKNVTNVQGVEPGEAGRDLEFYQTQYSLLEARSLAERVVRELRLASREDFFKAHGEDLNEDGLIGGSFSGAAVSEKDKANRQFDRTVRLLQKHIGISPIRGSRLVDVSYTSSSPELSAEIANAWSRQFVLQSMDRRLASTAEARTFLERRLAELRNRVEQSERDVVNYASDKGIISLGRVSSGQDRAGSGSAQENTLVTQDLIALNEALAQATADRIAAEGRARASGSGGASPEALGNLAINSLRQKRAEAAADYARILVQFTPEYAGAQALKKQIDALDAAIAREESRVVSTRQTSFADAKAREDTLRGQVAQLKLRLDRQQRDSIQYGIYQREADTNKQLYDALLQRFKEIGVAGIGADNIAIVDTAKIASKPSSPNLLLNLFVALGLGVLVATATTLALNQIDEGVRDPSQIDAALHLPLLGSVPAVDGDAIELVKDAKSEISEAYLSIRTNLAFTTDRGVPKSILVTSTRAAEGKTTSSIALATVLARVGKRVLLVDADMRSPSIHHLFGIDNEAGFSNYLSGDDDWGKFARPGPIPGLSLISAGPQPPSAAELLSTERSRQFLASALEHFEHVIVDSPPILGLADAPLLARTTEGVMMVVASGDVPLRGIQTAVGRLRSVNARIFGAILTKLEAKSAGYGYGYGLDYGYGQSRDIAE